MYIGYMEKSCTQFANVMCSQSVFWGVLDAVCTREHELMLVLAHYLKLHLAICSVLLTRFNAESFEIPWS